jgi:hypothetical protein
MLTGRGLRELTGFYGVSNVVSGSTGHHNSFFVRFFPTLAARMKSFGVLCVDSSSVSSFLTGIVCFVLSILSVVARSTFGHSALAGFSSSSKFSDWFQVSAELTLLHENRLLKQYTVYGGL